MSVPDYQMFDISNFTFDQIQDQRRSFFKSQQLQRNFSRKSGISIRFQIQKNFQNIIMYRVRHKFSNQLKCQYLKKYLTYWDKLFFINSTNSLQSFWHQNGVHGHNDGHFIGILVTPSTFFWHTQKKSSRRM
jgi:hypothetical protein